MKNKPTHAQFLAALEILKAYAPDKFLDIKRVKHKTALKSGHFLIRHEGYFHIASSITGEIVTNNVSLVVYDEIDKPLSATGNFVLQYGEVNPPVHEDKAILISEIELDHLKSMKMADDLIQQDIEQMITTSKALREALDRSDKAYVAKMKQGLWDRIWNKPTV